MDLSRMPNQSPLEKIISYLPYRERIRIGRVNKRFRQASIKVISETKTLHVKWQYPASSFFAVAKSKPSTALCVEERLIISNPLSPWQLKQSVLRHCAPNLISLRLDRDGGFHDRLFERCLASALCSLSYPKLEHLDLDGLAMSPPTFLTFFKKSPNLRTLIRRPPAPFKLPGGKFTADNLESITIEPVGDEMLKSMIGKLPRLRRLKLEKCQLHSASLNTFLANFPQLESLDIEYSIRNFGTSADSWKYLHQMDALWRLKHLKELGIRRDLPFIYVYEYLPIDLKKIIASFPDLRRLDLALIPLNKRDVIDLVRSLRQLEELSLDSGDGEEPEITLDTEIINEVIKLPRLKVLKFPNGYITSPAYATLVRSCPHLTELELKEITDLGYDQEIDKVLCPFEGCGTGGGVGREIKITFNVGMGDGFDSSDDASHAHDALNMKDARDYMRSLKSIHGITLKVRTPHLPQYIYECGVRRKIGASSSDEDELEDEDD